MNKILALAFLSAFATASFAQSDQLDVLPERQELLNGKTLVFEYTNGWGFSLSFYDNKLKYQFRRDLSNPEGVGSRNQDIPYRSRQVGDDMYQIMWHEPDVKDVVTMLINFNTSTLYAAGILGYDEDRYEVFEGAIIQQVIDDQ